MMVLRTFLIMLTQKTESKLSLFFLIIMKRQVAIISLAKTKKRFLSRLSHRKNIENTFRS